MNVRTPNRRAALARMRARMVVADVIEDAVIRCERWTWETEAGNDDRDLVRALNELVRELRDTKR
jgi:hypothetical protein